MSSWTFIPDGFYQRTLMPLTNFLEFKSRSLIQNSLVYNRQKVIVGTKCLDIRPGSVFKNLDTQQSKILTNFLEIACLTPLRTSDICLEISSDYKHCLGLKLEATVELGHRVKSQCFRHLEKIIFKFWHTKATLVEYPQKLSTKPHQSV